jgi:hypothetical protein
MEKEYAAIVTGTCTSQLVHLPQLSALALRPKGRKGEGEGGRPERRRVQSDTRYYVISLGRHNLFLRPIPMKIIIYRYTRDPSLSSESSALPIQGGQHAQPWKARMHPGIPSDKGSC